jgi:hypothetical protein
MLARQARHQSPDKPALAGGLVGIAFKDQTAQYASESKTPSFENTFPRRGKNLLFNGNDALVFLCN